MVRNIKNGKKISISIASEKSENDLKLDNNINAKDMFIDDD